MVIKDTKAMACILFILLLSIALTRHMVWDYYTIATSSMEPTILTGETVRTYNLPGIRKIRPNDIIIFYKPVGHKKDEVYCKRTLGCPGDRIGAVDGHYWNDRVLRPIGVVEEQEKLRWMFEGFFRLSDSYDIFPFSNTDWNIKNWGPVVVPAKGWTVTLDSITRELYRTVIELETGEPLKDCLMEYTFKGDYYYAVGDNAMSSFDSRYWGFIPEDFIIGIVGGKRFRNK